MLSIGSTFFTFFGTDKQKNSTMKKCCLPTVALEALAGIALMTIAGLVLTGKMTPFCSTAGTYAIIGAGAFCALPAAAVIAITLASLFRSSCGKNGSKAKSD